MHEEHASADTAAEPLPRSTGRGRALWQIRTERVLLSTAAYKAESGGERLGFEPADYVAPFELKRLDEYAEQISKYTIYVIPLVYFLIYSVFVSREQLVIFESPIPVSFFLTIVAVSLIFIVYHHSDLMNQIYFRIRDISDTRPGMSNSQSLNAFYAFLSATRAVASFPGALNPLFPHAFDEQRSPLDAVGRGFLWLLGTRTLRLTFFMLMYAVTFGLLVGSLAAPIVVILQHGAQGLGGGQWLLWINTVLAVFVLFLIFKMLRSLSRTVGTSRAAKTARDYIDAPQGSKEEARAWEDYKSALSDMYRPGRWIVSRMTWFFFAFVALSAWVAYSKGDPSSLLAQFGSEALTMGLSALGALGSLLSLPF